MSLVSEKRALDLEEEGSEKKGRPADSAEKLKAKGQEMMAKHPELFDEERLQKTRELATRLWKEKMAKAKAQEMMAEHPELFADNYTERLQKTHEFARRVFLLKGLDKKC